MVNSQREIEIEKFFPLSQIFNIFDRRVIKFEEIFEHVDKKNQQRDFA